MAKQLKTENLDSMAKICQMAKKWHKLVMAKIWRKFGDGENQSQPLTPC